VFAATYPAVPIHPERVLLISGAREELVSSGASSTWHDMVLHLIARYAGSTAAQEVARIFALQWHHDGLTPYIVFEGKTDHGDAVIQRAQEWLSERFSVANPVEEMIRHSAVAERTFKRRFASATGLTPIAYVQRLRVEDAKRRLERTEAPVDEISWRVGYEDPAFFRRLFKRTTGLAPGAYRKRFRIPEFRSTIEQQRATRRWCHSRSVRVTPSWRATAKRRRMPTSTPSCRLSRRWSRRVGGADPRRRGRRATARIRAMARSVLKGTTSDVSTRFRSRTSPPARADLITARSQPALRFFRECVRPRRPRTP
jgi:AraC-like DNA-binding protein